MLLGFISLLLTVLKGTLSEICIPKAIANSWLPCDKKFEEEHEEDFDGDDGHRKLLSFTNLTGTSRRRSLAAAAYTDKCAAKGKVQFLSEDALHQLHLFIFALAVFHVLSCIITLGLGRAKMGKWKTWESETKTLEYQCSQGAERYRFARDTTFGRRHLNIWCRSPILIWIVCFFRQFLISVPKVDYLTLRHGFIVAHLAPQSQTNFDFQKYINRSLEEDFKVVVGISPPIWFFSVLFILFNTNSWKSYLWLPFIPLIIVLLVGTKLQVIITKMGLRIQDRGQLVQGSPLVQPDNDLFWFNRPGLLLYLIHFVLFQNAFQFAFFAWAWYEFGTRSCSHDRTEDVIIRLSMGVIVQILCSYVTLPLYALVTQMGSTMKPTIFDERVAKALHRWQQDAKKNIKKNRQAEGSATPSPKTPNGPPLCKEGEVKSVQSPPKLNNFHNVHFEACGSSSFSEGHASSKEIVGDNPSQCTNSSSVSEPLASQHQIDIL
ncbi:MLO-like protein 12 [Apium graveolens]|uniref:MLO-like protein 12 n=1 Tax=Apium graveolens TaxID=4045 RepID=UPI003D7B9D59